MSSKVYRGMYDQRGRVRFPKEPHALASLPPHLPDNRLLSRAVALAIVLCSRSGCSAQRSWETGIGVASSGKIHIQAGEWIH